MRKRKPGAQIVSDDSSVDLKKMEKQRGRRMVDGQGDSEFSMGDSGESVDEGSIYLDDQESMDAQNNQISSVTYQNQSNNRRKTVTFGAQNNNNSANRKNGLAASTA